ncbi:uncharacterized protein LOC131252870 isoform X2 [Magnolia sinica]|uniref:uncharacterized protein LOC131252870 isoform X2 n=1 Tax=Magnolia sinica TaxID=86752 RepID=UPI002659FEA2|nr:uncharacterized protein LOC131252870 isoform X2 [Magnolia sinica]
MSKRELSTTLKNLKFMQRAVQKQEKTKSEQELKPDRAFVSSTTQNRKCKVIMEGNPHPGALKGRMSFQSFNPSIDKLNEEAENPCQPQTSATSSGDQDEQMPDRENGFSQTRTENSNIAGESSPSDPDHKRKQLEMDGGSQSPYKSQRKLSKDGDGQSSSNDRKGSFKQPKRDKLDWSVLRPPKPSTKQS